MLMDNIIIEDPSRARETAKKIACQECRRLHEEVRLHIEHSISMLIPCNSAYRTVQGQRVNVVCGSVEPAGMTWTLGHPQLVARSSLIHQLSQRYDLTAPNSDI